MRWLQPGRVWLPLETKFMFEIGMRFRLISLGLIYLRIGTQLKSQGKWFSYLKGGGYRKWYGNKFDVVNWEDDGFLLQTKKHPSEDRVWATNFNLEFVLMKTLIGGR